jgi:hypothetical protein
MRRATNCGRSISPQVVGITLPFPGTVIGGLRVARRFKALNHAIRVVIGGGWVNTSLRSLATPELFDYVDYVTLDGG